MVKGGSTAASSASRRSSSRQSKRKVEDDIYEWGGQWLNDDDDEIGPPPHAPANRPSANNTISKEGATKVNKKKRTRSVVHEDGDYEGEEEEEEGEDEGEEDEEDEEEQGEEDEDDAEGEEDEAVRLRRQLLLRSSMDAAVISSGMLEQEDIYKMSQVCHALNGIVKQRVKHVRGGPALMADICQRFPGARKLTVDFEERFIPEANMWSDPPTVPMTAMTWRIPSSLGRFSPGAIDISQLQGLTIRARIHDGYETTKQMRRDALLLKEQQASIRGKGKKRKKLGASNPHRHPFSPSYKEIVDPFLFMLPHLPTPNRLTSLSLIISRNALDEPPPGISTVLLQAALSLLQHLKIECAHMGGDKVVGAIWPAIEQQKLPRLKSLQMKWSSERGLLPPASSRLGADFLLGLASRVIPELSSVSLERGLGSNFSCLLTTTTAARPGINLHLARFETFYVSDSQAIGCFPRFVSSHSDFGAALICSKPPGTKSESRLGWRQYVGK